MLVTVVPGSGTDALSGIAGTMTILINGTKHSYQFESEGGSSASDNTLTHFGSGDASAS
jgi:hypothetical protein